jgi:hypothetical protein
MSSAYLWEKAPLLLVPVIVALWIWVRSQRKPPAP